MRKRAEGRAAEVQERIPPVLSNRPFRLLWLAQIISQTAQNAILYALIIVVLDLTESTTSTSVVVLLFVVPTAGFGLFAGVLVDRWSKRRLLIMSNAGRAITALAYFFARDHVWALYTVTPFFATCSQVFTTSNAASIPHMVPRQQLISANTLFSGGFTIAQLAGLIFLSPLILTTAGAGTLFISAAGAFVLATLLTRLLPFIGHDGEEEVDRLFPSRAELRGAVSEFATAMRSVRADPLSTMAMAHITASSTLILLFAIIVPRYMQAILKVEADKAVTVFAPVAIGALIGLRFVPMMVGRLGKTRTVALGLFGVALCLMALGFVERIADALEQTERLNPFEGQRVFGLSILVALTMLFAGPMGVCYALLNTPAQTTLHERTPIDMRGRVIASQMVLANGVALIPLVVVGGIADLYGVSSVVLAISGLLVVAGALTLYVERRWLQQQDDQPPPDGVKAIARPQEPVPGSIDTT
jgi:MFS family permease